MNRNLSNNLNKERLFMNEIVGIAATTTTTFITFITMFSVMFTIWLFKMSIITLNFFQTSSMIHDSSK